MISKDEKRKRDKPCACCGKLFRTRKAACCSRDCYARLRRGQRARVEDGIGVIPLTCGEVAIVDEADFKRVNAHVWNLQISATGNRYARRMAILPNGVRRQQQMHRFILGEENRSIHIDHKDGNGLNNRRANIRPCLIAENNRNRRKIKTKTSRFKGVTYRRQAKRWEAKIRVSKMLIYLGHYMTEDDAARAYNEAARTHFGEFANLNEVSGPPPIKNKHEGYASRRNK